jgi:ABC-type multidrug transport system permease subunit
MKALILGIVLIAVAVYAGLNWWGDVLSFLRGALPVIAAFIGLIAVFIGVVDIRDRAQAKKDEATEPDQQ